MESRSLATPSFFIHGKKDFRKVNGAEGRALEPLECGLSERSYPFFPDRGGSPERLHRSIRFRVWLHEFQEETESRVLYQPLSCLP